ncbi:hypothetical protein CLOM_g18694 [Closterium sp. NIES-68]|nr:hypothetical protein CLOM_g19325 [Closterium sp. NIES-68]GJP34247.1 hypothetical protein CLOM_g18694 [Closterium sp. NIES-68]GJP58949.1 hypothetical protein CLOP_g6717 [Closterium sp. NIES-67]
MHSGRLGGRLPRVELPGRVSGWGRRLKATWHQVKTAAEQLSSRPAAEAATEAATAAAAEAAAAEVAAAVAVAAVGAGGLEGRLG